MAFWGQRMHQRELPGGRGTQGQGSRKMCLSTLQHNPEFPKHPGGSLAPTFGYLCGLRPPSSLSLILPICGLKIMASDVEKSVLNKGSVITGSHMVTGSRIPHHQVQSAICPIPHRLPARTPERWVGVEVADKGTEAQRRVSTLAYPVAQQ